MITPRVTRLVRVPDLHAFREAIASLAPGTDVSVRRTAVLVPTRGAGEALRRSLEARMAGGGALLLPDIVTRTELYRRLHAGTSGLAPLLSDTGREVLLGRAAREAVAAGAIPPFRLRAGLVVQMLEFYDDLRRREQSLDDFSRHTAVPLAESADTDRGAERLLRQTEFLSRTFAAFERATVATGRLDEHALRSCLLDGTAPAQRAYRHVIVTVADQAADALGLYPSDFDLLSRLPALERLDVVATEHVLSAGFHERVHQLLPGIDETRAGAPSPRPTLVVPESSDPDQRWFVCRDREEELAEIVRSTKHRARSPHETVRPPALDRIGIVFQRPLPYLYLARQVFEDGGVPYEALDALPLSAEPFAATMDVIFSFLSSEANRASAMELLASPHLSFREALGAREIAALDQSMRDAKYAGGWDLLARLEMTRGKAALESVRSAAGALRPVLGSSTASAQFDALLAFLRQFEAPAGEDHPALGRHRRARSAILSALHALRDAHALYDEQPLPVAELTGAVRRWIEAQTFSPRTGTGGLWLLDAASASYADLDEMRIVGLVDRDWPEPIRRSVFYPASILANLAWPMDASRTTAARGRFQDLLCGARTRVSLSLFTLEDDAIVAPSALLEDVDLAGLPVERWPAPPEALVFAHEAAQHATGAGEPGPPAAGTAAEWLALRLSGTAPRDARFRGFTGAREPETYAISYLERYLECPFKYFAGRVLRLPEEREEESGLSPLERGHFVHDVFETFFKEWQAAGGGTITTSNVADALEMFERIAEQKLECLPEADRALERTHLLGSAVASGLAERAFAFEIEQGGEVIERLLEHPLEGEFRFTGPDGERTLRIRAKADRLDLMADGTVRVIDYKLGKAPKASKALQLPIYGVMAAQALAGHRGRVWTVASAGYVAFKEKEPFVPLGGKPGAVTAAIAEGQARLLETVAAIERGEFPVEPDEPFRCQWCGYAGVCRKDYVGDE